MLRSDSDEFSDEDEYEDMEDEEARYFAQFNSAHGNTRGRANRAGRSANTAGANINGQTMQCAHQ